MYPIEPCNTYNDSHGTENRAWMSSSIKVHIFTHCYQDFVAKKVVDLEEVSLELSTRSVGHQTQGVIASHNQQKDFKASQKSPNSPPSFGGIPWLYDFQSTLNTLYTLETSYNTCD